MDAIGTYVLSVAAIAVLCGVVGRFSGKGGTSGAVRLVTGLLLTMAVLSPLKDIRAQFPNGLGADISQQVRQAVSDGETQRKKALSDRISEQTCAYILRKAESFGADLDVSVTLTDEDLPTPKSVTIRAAVPEYVKTRLQDMIEQDLGIAKEDQRWI